MRVASRVACLPESGIRRIIGLTVGGGDLVSLGLGEPDFATPGVIVEEAVASLGRGETGYAPLPGLPALRAAVAHHLERLYGVAYDPGSEILITVGTTEGMYAALSALLDPGDEVLVAQPAFLSYIPTVLLAGGTVAAVPTQVENRFRVTASEVEAAVTPRSRILLLNYPNNPTGAVLDRPAAEEVAEVARRHDLVVVSDEIYDRLVYGVEHVCIPSLEGMRERTVLLGGFSKCYAMTGWRLGYAAGPAELIEAMVQVHQCLVMCAPTTAQKAALVALDQGDEAVEEMRGTYERRRRLLVDGLNRLGLPCVEPQGAFFAFPSVRATGLSDVDFAERLVQEERALVVPGSLFGAAGAGFVRCSFAPSPGVIEEALARIGRFVERLAVEAGDRRLATAGGT